MVEIISILLNLVLGGGLIVTLSTLKSTREKADAESKQKYLDLSKSYVEAFQENIVKPLEENIDEYKKEVAGLRREVAKFRKAIEKAKTCEYNDVCPVRNELQKCEDREATRQRDNETAGS